MATVRRMPRPAKRARRRRGPGWVPNQHGAWAMLLAPLVVGAVHGGPGWVHLLLLVAWVVAYLAFYAAGLWLRARLRPRYRPPVVAYGTATAVLGVGLITLEPAVATWGLVYAPLLATSLVFSWRRRDRALGNDLVTVLAACLMAVVAYGLGTRAGAGDGVLLGGAGGGLATGPGGVLPGAASASAWAIAAVLLAYFFGTVLYVKTMIRERANRRMYLASVSHHVVVALVAWLSGVDVLVSAVLTLLAVRAAVVPRRWPTATPRALGMGEIAATAALAAALLLT